MKKYIIDVESNKTIPIDKFIEYLEERIEEGVYDKLLADRLSERGITTYDVFFRDNKAKKDFFLQFAKSLIMTDYNKGKFLVVEIDK